jgi:hypothetical protein
MQAGLSLNRTSLPHSSRTGGRRPNVGQAHVEPFLLLFPLFSDPSVFTALLSELGVKGELSSSYCCFRAQTGRHLACPDSLFLIRPLPFVPFRSSGRGSVVPGRGGHFQPRRDQGPHLSLQVCQRHRRVNQGWRARELNIPPVSPSSPPFSSDASLSPSL